MRVLQAHKFFFPQGGAEHHLFDLIALLEHAGDQCIPFATKDVRNVATPYEKFFPAGASFADADAGSFIERLWRLDRMIYSRPAKNALARLLSQERIDIAHVHNIYHHLSPSILVALKQKNIPIVMTIHDYKLLCPNYTFYHHGAIHEEDGRGWYLSCVGNRCLRDSRGASAAVTLEMILHHKFFRYYERLVDHFIAPSQFVYDLFIRFGWPKEKITMLPHFLPLEFSPVATVAPAPAQPRFAYVGRLSEEKGIDRLIRWWIDARISYPLDVYGDGPLATSLRTMTKQHPTAHITFYGNVPRTEPYQNPARYTAMVMPTTFYEPFGLVAIEAFAHGIPVVAAQSGALPQLVHASVAGTVFSWERPDTLTDALSFVIAHPELRENALVYMRGTHTPEQYLRRLKEEIYAPLLKQTSI